MGDELLEPTGDLALDLVNTIVPGREGPVDLLSGPAAVEAWLHAVGLGEVDTALTLPARKRILDEARRLRSDVARLLDARSRGQSLPEDALFALDRVLAAGRRTTRLTMTDGSPRLTETDEALSPVGVLTPAARAAARLLTEADPERLRSCGAPDCVRWFLDSSRGGRRRWCSMTTCGNRAKAARYRRRHGGRRRS
jgi:predicted RNA-binding Zn ribbon-like protein